MGNGNPQPIPVSGTGGFPCIGGPTTSDATVTAMGTVGETHAIRNIQLDLDHTFAADLDIELIAPSGTIWGLSSDNGADGDDYTNTIFMDGFPSITTGVPPFAGIFEAEQGPLNTGFAGEPINGNWQLSICDDSGGDIGTLDLYSITFQEIVGGDANDVTIACDASTDPEDTGSPFVSDNCDPEPVVNFNDVVTSGSCPGNATIVRTWTATDASGNSATCVQTITIEDTVPPQLACPPLTFVECGSSTDPADIGTATAIDNCDPNPEVIYSDEVVPGVCGMEMTITRTWVATDVCGNSSSCIQTIEVLDNEPPMAICQDITIDFNDGLTVIIDPEDVDGGSFDNCGDVTLVLSDDTFECSEFINTSTQVIQLTVTDACGLMSTCDVTVTGVGAQLAIYCPVDITVNLDPGLCEAIVNYTITAENLCNPNNPPDINQIDASGLSSGDFFPIGTTEQTWEASLPGVTPVSCSFTITVIEFPNAVPPACNNLVQVSLDQNCEARICADVLL
jgi:subtilisin-like proprotein convertase family protein